MKTLKFIAATCLTLAAATAMAAVTFDPATGAGFVGKGDVQLAFGWNNAQLQANASGVGFNYVATDTYTAVCTWITGEGTRGERTHNVSRTSTTGIASTVTYDTRTRNQITGFNLTGLAGSAIEAGSIPVVGGECAGNGTGGTWSSVALTSSVSQLNVTYGTVSVKIWPPAPV